MTTVIDGLKTPRDNSIDNNPTPVCTLPPRTKTMTQKKNIFGSSRNGM